MSNPLIAVTMGDAAGVGPEVIVGCWNDPAIHDLCRPVVVGHPEILRRAAARLRVPVEVREVAAPEQAAPTSSIVPIVRGCDDEVLSAPPSTADARCGRAAYDCLTTATDWALAERVQAVVTAPLHKAALHAAGHRYPGHTELLAERCGVAEFAMMLYLGPQPALRGPAGLGVVHVTLHMALRDVFTHLTTPEISSKIELAHDVLGRLKGTMPRIAVAALNPHGGESGLFGDEETRLIAPAVAAAQVAGYDVAGPLPVDTLMCRARDGEFDGVVAMYHDQGHIALKLLGMHRAVNVTLGLPIVRTSVAHGTAFDLAWQGKADPSSMVEAIRVAALLVERRRVGSRAFDGADSTAP